MKLCAHRINDVDTWHQYAPPKEKEKHWKVGRSAQALAAYMTEALPELPTEIEALLGRFTSKDAELHWDAEFVTALPGKGNGRNHDAVIYNEDIFVGIEGKADESFGNKYIAEELVGASDNKRSRIEQLTKMIFGDAPEAHPTVRYQLLTACAGILIEARKRGIQNALFLILVFKKEKAYSQAKLIENNKDLNAFLRELQAAEIENGLYILPTRYGKAHEIDLYMKKIEIAVV